MQTAYHAVVAILVSTLIAGLIWMADHPSTTQKTTVQEPPHHKLFAKDIKRIKRFNQDEYDVLLVGDDGVVRTMELRFNIPVMALLDFDTHKYRQVIVDVPEDEEPHAIMFFFNGDVTGFELHVNNLDQIEM